MAGDRGSWWRILLQDEDDVPIDVIRRRLRRHRAQRDRARDAGGGLAERVARLEAENDELRLHVAVVMRHLLAKKLLLHTEIEALLGEMDGEGGVQDRRRRGPIA